MSLSASPDCAGKQRHWIGKLDRAAWCWEQDTLSCMALCESVYKVVDFGESQATAILGAVLESFPQQLVTLRRVEWSKPDAEQRYLS